MYRRLEGSHSRKPDSLQLVGIVTPADVVLTFRWLYEGSDWAKSDAMQYAIRLGRLQEATHDTVAALASYQVARREAERSARYYLAAIDAAIARLSRR